jgi:HAD superfamily hydrolase (TIGR01509 family)
MVDQVTLSGKQAPTCCSSPIDRQAHVYVHNERRYRVHGQASQPWPCGESMTTFRAVAWDIDGTLIDSEPLHQRALVAGSAVFGADLGALDPEAFRGVHARDVWNALKPRFAPEAKFETWIATIEDYYVAHAGELQPNLGAIEAMRELAARGVAQACVSNSGRRIVDANIKALGISEIIAFSLSLDDVSAGKPDPTPFREAARRLGAEPQEVVAVEDSGAGARSARAAGLYVVGYAPEGGAFVGSDLTIAHLGKVPALFSG